MRVLVTGHRGFIGTVMVPILQSSGHEIVGLDSDLYRNSTYGDPPSPPDREILKDIRDVESEDLDGVEAIVHLAGLSNDVLGDLDQERTYDINYRASVRLAEMAKALGVTRYVFASSCSMYGAAGDDFLDETAPFSPVTAYAKSKVLVEQAVSQMADDRFTPTFMRNATAYGVSPRIRFDVVVNNLTAWAYTTGQVLMKSDGSPWRPVVHIADISRAVLAVLQSPREKVHNEAFNVGRNSENYRIRDIALMVQETVPDCELHFAAGASPDLRNYRVNFDKYAETFPDYPLQWSVRAGIEDIYASYRRIGLGRDDYEGPHYKRIAQLQFLLDSGQLDDSLRWRG